MLELVALMGNIVAGENHHTHALFSFVEDGAHRVLAGHLKETVVLYTAEIELRPIVGGVIGQRHDPETGTVSGILNRRRDAIAKAQPTELQED